jgi:hypothetical protein
VGTILSTISPNKKLIYENPIKEVLSQHPNIKKGCFATLKKGIIEQNLNTNF